MKQQDDNYGMKFIYMLKNQMKQNINTFLNNVKKQS